MYTSEVSKQFTKVPGFSHLLIKQKSLYKASSCVKPFLTIVVFWSDNDY